MYDKERINITKNTIEVLESLKLAIHKAGGIVNINRICEMSVVEFLSIVCVPNGVRFCYGEPKNTVDEDIIYTKQTEEDFENYKRWYEATICDCGCYPYHNDNLGCNCNIPPAPEQKTMNKQYCKWYSKTLCVSDNACKGCTYNLDQYTKTKEN